MKTEFEFELPRGYVDDAGNVHRYGTMRLALAMDEIVPMRDLRVQNNPAYATILILARVITHLGAAEVSPALLENLFAGDLNYLQDFYRQINNEAKPDESKLTFTIEESYTDKESANADKPVAQPMAVNA